MARKPFSESNPQEPTGPQSGADTPISLDDIERMAREIDAINAQEPQKKARKPRAAAGDGQRTATVTDTDTGEETEIPVQPPDPEFVFMVTHGTNQGIDFMKEQFRLMEPGVTTRNKIGMIAGRLANRVDFLSGGQGSWWTDLVIVAGYLLMWFFMGRMPAEPSRQIPANTETPK